MKYFTTTATKDSNITVVPEPERWRLREAVGKYGTFVIITGAITTPVLLAILIAIWGGRNGDSGENASQEWRWLVLNGRITAAVTLLSGGIQISSSLQSLICTSLAAATILETSGVPLSQLAEMSMMRGVNDGPWRLVYLTLTSSWRKIFALQPLLVLALYASTVATQFGSTILVTDLDLMTIMGQHNRTTIKATIPAETLKYAHVPDSWLMAPKYYTFGEVPSGVDPSPSPGGVSDTGNLRRFFQPFDNSNATRMRNYEGASYGWNSRIVCAPPVLNGTFRAAPRGFSSMAYIPTMSGNISYTKSFDQAGLDNPTICDGPRCLTTSFNCPMVVARNRAASGLGMCVPDLDTVTVKNTTTWLNDGRATPINPHSMVYLLTRTNGTLKDWSFIGNRSTIPPTVTHDGEWAMWRLGPSQVDFAMTMCFVSSVWEKSTVQMSSDRDTVVAGPELQQDGTTYDTRNLIKQLGMTKKPYTNRERSIFTVNSINNTQTHTNETYKLDIALYDLMSGGRPASTDYTMFLGLAGYGALRIAPFQDFNGVFEDVLAETRRPALALQAMIGLKLQNVYYALIPSMINPTPVTVTESVPAQVPVRWTGLLIYAAILGLHFLSVVAITASFLLRTRYSKQGHFWHTISQVITDDTVTILQHAAESRDDHAMARTNTFNSSLTSSTSTTTSSAKQGRGAAGISRKPSYKLEQDPIVVVSRSVKTGRVQVIRKDELGNV